MKKIGLFVVGIIMTTMAFSQTANPELISSGGDSFSNTTYLLDWSIGECVTATHSEGDYVITQGFHQDTYVITTEVSEFIINWLLRLYCYYYNFQFANYQALKKQRNIVSNWLQVSYMNISKIIRFDKSLNNK